MAPAQQDGFFHRLATPGGTRAVIARFGARLVSLQVPDARGAMRDVVLGFDTLDGYRTDTSYQGATIGRYANRIAGARFKLGGCEHRLSANEGRNTLHGGTNAFDRRDWHVDEAGAERLVLSLQSPDGDGGFPGNLVVSVTYALSPPARLSISYAARSDANTVINLTNHSYFNLDGAGAASIDAHVLQLDASKYTEIDRELIPTGRLVDVAATPFDFRRPTTIGPGLSTAHPQILLAGGYDHSFVLDGGVVPVPRPVAWLLSPASGIVMEIATTEPGIQFYSGHQLNPSDIGKSGVRYRPRSGLCLETQHFPDSPNRPGFPSTFLRAHETFTSETTYTFGVEH